MADYRSEEEQIEILKKWWQENGRSMVAGVCIALVGYFGWAWWHGYQQSKIEAAADLYQQMVPSRQEGAQPLDKTRVTAIAEQLRKDYPGTVYAIFASLHLSKEAVAAKDFPRAIELLNWASDHKPDAALIPLLRLRTAQVQYAQAQYDVALATLSEVKDSGAWKSDFSELRGDLLLAQGKADLAREAYADALKALDESGTPERRQNIEMKQADATQSTQALPTPAVTGGKT
ncbi:MAG TPA: tetratricopeptide repeat protein [Pseudomonadales bacterium]|nr:tetratricopeptide repeat protein [Pseudomonadales bacterium]